MTLLSIPPNKEKRKKKNDNANTQVAGLTRSTNTFHFNFLKSCTRLKEHKDRERKKEHLLTTGLTECYQEIRIMYML